MMLGEWDGKRLLELLFVDFNIQDEKHFDLAFDCRVVMFPIKKPNRIANQRSDDFRLEFRKKFHGASAGDSAHFFGSRKQQFFRKVFRQVARYLIDLRALDPDDPSATEPVPYSANPRLLDAAINQNVMVGQTAFRELDNFDVGRCLTESPAKVCSELVESLLEMLGRVFATLNLDGASVRVRK